MAPAPHGRLRPSDVFHRAKRLVWWKCPKGPDHEWRASVYDRSRAAGCPFCRGRRVSVTNSLQAQFPDVAREWHPTRNGSLTPATVVGTAREHCWWRCARGHVWRELVRNRTVGRPGCPVCAASNGR